MRIAKAAHYLQQKKAELKLLEAYHTFETTKSVLGILLLKRCTEGDREGVGNVAESLRKFNDSRCKVCYRKSEETVH